MQGHEDAAAANGRGIVERFREDILRANSEVLGHAPAHANRSSVENGVSLGGFVDERLIAGDEQGALRIEAGTFCAVVADVQDDVAVEFPLDVEIPDLDVAEPVIGVDGKIIGHGGLRGGGETVEESERRWTGEAGDGG